MNDKTAVAYLLYDIYLSAERVTHETEHQAGQDIQNLVNRIREILYPDGEVNDTVSESE